MTTIDIVFAGPNDPLLVAGAFSTKATGEENDELDEFIHRNSRWHNDC